MGAFNYYVRIRRNGGTSKCKGMQTVEKGVEANVWATKTEQVQTRREGVCPEKI